MQDWSSLDARQIDVTVGRQGFVNSADQIKESQGLEQASRTSTIQTSPLHTHE
jgi:hypothetical protein